MRKALSIVAVCCASALLVACGGGGGGDEGSSTNAAVTTTAASGGDVSSVSSDPVQCAASSALVSVSGVVSYERVPLSNIAGRGLDYNNIQSLPVRAVTVQAIAVTDGSFQAVSIGGFNVSECVFSSTVTSSSGGYSLSVQQNATVRIRVKAETKSTASASWDFEVRDNTRGNALYVLDGASVSVGASNSIRNLTAGSGWTGSSYGESRSSAPFAILDSIYESIQTVVAVDPTVAMDDADFFWSVNNSTASGTLSNGEIGTSFYSNDQIYVLGRENSDTDEFDEHVIIHEWGHFFEDNLARLDSVGGSHTITAKLDMRVALSEGFSNALSGIVTDDPAYRDSFGSQQGSDFEINIETNAATNVGWFNEGSIQTILYDIYDSTADANDAVNLGFSAIYNAMTSLAYTEQPGLASIFSMMNRVLSNNPGSAAAINTLVNSQSIDTIVDDFGTGETNDGGDANNLPVYKVIADNGIAVQVCSSNANSEPNRLGNRQLIRLSVATGGAHTITATRNVAASSLTSSDPDIRVYLNGVLTFLGVSSAVDVQTVTGSFNVDDYIIEVYEFSNIDNSSTTGGNVCFDVSVS